MGKKYLDTKQNTIEASVLDIWAKSSEEQEAIRNAAEMFVKEKYDQAAIDAKTDAEMRAKGYTYRRGAARVYGGSKRDPRVPPGATPIIPVNRSGMPKRSKVGKVLGALGRLSKEEYETFIDELMLDEGWFKDLVDKKRTGAKAAGSKKPDPGHAGPKDKPEKPKPSIISAIKDVYGRLFNGDFIGMTAYLNTLNEDQSSDQIAVIIGDINETALTLINPYNLDQTMSINLDNLHIDINEDGELEFYEAVDPKTIPVWNPRKGGGRTGQKPPLK